MKIVVKKRRDAMEHTSAEDVMKTTLAHITHKICIISVQSDTQDTDHDQITVNYSAQPGTSGVDFSTLIRDAISLRGYLQLVSLELPPRTRELKGITLEANTSESTTYKIQDFCAQYMARNDNILAQCSRQNVYEMKFEFEETGSSQLTYTGRVSLTSNGLVNAIPSVYTKFANLLLANPDLKKEANSNAKCNTMMN